MGLNITLSALFVDVDVGLALDEACYILGGLLALEEGCRLLVHDVEDAVVIIAALVVVSISSRIWSICSASRAYIS